MDSICEKVQEDDQNNENAAGSDFETSSLNDDPTETIVDEFS